MARCGCNSALECGCAAGVSDCVAMSGTGAPGDPFVPVLMLSEDSDNAAECRDDGLYVPDLAYLALRIPTQAYVATYQARTNTAYGDLATVGPAVTATTGTSALVSILASLASNTVHEPARMSIAVSGATTVAASDVVCIAYQPYATNAFGQFGGTFLITGLNPGSNTFTAKYRSLGAATATFGDRRLIVIPY